MKKLKGKTKEKWRGVWNELQKDFGHPRLSTDDLYHIIKWWEQRQQNKLFAEGSVHIGPIGTIRLEKKSGHCGYMTQVPNCPGEQVYVPPAEYRLHLKITSSRPMRRRIMKEKHNDEGMVKLGVHTQHSQETGAEKTATTNVPELCPLCGHPVQTVMGQRMCPNHGTAPFER